MTIYPHTARQDPDGTLHWLIKLPKAIDCKICFTPFDVIWRIHNIPLENGHPIICHGCQTIWIFDEGDLRYPTEKEILKLNKHKSAINYIKEKQSKKWAENEK